MKKLITIAALALFAQVPAWAAPASNASIETLLTLTKAEQLLDTLYGTMEQQIQQGMNMAAGNRSLTPEQQKLLETLPGRMAQVMRQEMSWSALKPLLVSVYADTFDQEEIDGLIGFYRTPIGQRFINKQSALALRSTQATQQLVLAAMPRMQQAMQAALSEAGLR